MLDTPRQYVSGRRAVDQIPIESPRPRQMEVLCLGLSRTGTMSLQLALEKLGYKAYHYNQIGQVDLPNESHIDSWMEAFRAKMYGNGKPFDRVDFDRILRNYSEALYPLLEGLRYPLLYWTAGDWQNRERLGEAFDKHYAHVREIAPADNLLEWQVTDGWEPLCEFLDKPVPKEPFPHINKGDDVQKLFFMIGRIRLATLVFQALKLPVALGGSVALAWYLHRKWS